MLGEDPDAERGDELQDDRAGHVLDAIQHPQRDHAQHRTDDDAAGDGEQERRRDRADREAAAGDGRRSRGGRSAARWRRSAGSRPRGSSGCGAAGAAAGAPRWPRRRPAAPRRRRARSPAPRAGPAPAPGRRTATATVVSPTANDDQAGDRQPVVAQVARRGVVGGVEQDRRDEEGERQLGRDGELRRARHEGEQRAAQREEHGVGRADAARRRPPAARRRGRARELFEFAHGVARQLHTAERLGTPGA